MPQISLKLAQITSVWFLDMVLGFGLVLFLELDHDHDHDLDHDNDFDLDLEHELEYDLNHYLDHNLYGLGVGFVPFLNLQSPLWENMLSVIVIVIVIVVVFGKNKV